MTAGGDRREIYGYEISGTYIRNDGNFDVSAIRSYRVGARQEARFPR